MDFLVTLSLGRPLCVFGEWGESLCNYDCLNRKIEDNCKFCKRATPSADNPQRDYSVYGVLDCFWSIASLSYKYRVKRI